ncbi:pollen-specific leucine-rich repeat extensin-like protein 4 [Macadamia integrifolia]|uniref:pollen-specific leucine-rich repeat extensin-like protein 4 n=1 Tax=Macadamia integrifolia TaxID=60698 RepID=UPI001C4ED508|nr:pollen-specific leucine-rich repeat extensin-like protein 4 [Macadamia integrifolia]
MYQQLEALHPRLSMAAFGIQRQMLEVTVVRCIRLKDTEWRISRQDPYVCIEYGSTKFRTSTCTDGGTNPVYEEKFMFNLIEGLRELNINVWNSNTLSSDDFIGRGKVQLQKVLSQGFDDTSWTIVDRKERFSGEVQLMLQYTHASERSMASKGYSFTPGPPPPGTTTIYPYLMPTTYCPAPTPYPSSYPPNGIAAHSSSTYHPTTLQAAYPPQPYPPPTQTYPPPTQTYPPQPYPPPKQTYPPPNQTYPPPTLIYPPPPPGYQPGTSLRAFSCIFTELTVRLHICSF